MRRAGRESEARGRGREEGSLGDLLHGYTARALCTTLAINMYAQALGADPVKIMCV